MNAKETNYRAKSMKRKKELISDVFTVTDEACAVMMVKNYLGRWRKMSEEKDSTKHRGAEFDAKFTSSRKGKRVNTWSDEGRQKFHEWCFKIAKLRQKTETGKQIDELTRNHYRGGKNHVETKESQAPTFLVYEEKEWEEEERIIAMV